MTTNCSPPAARARPRTATRALARALARAAALAALLGAAALLPRPGAAQAGGPAPHAITLDNGLQVIVVENHSVPLATAEIVVRAGAMTQADDEQGVPHLFEHMLFKGYRGVDGRSFATEAAALQAGYNGTTSTELVTYYLTLPSAGVDDGVRLLARLVRGARFSAADLKVERFVVLGEMQRDLSDPRAVLGRSMAQDLWRAGWPRKNTIGESTALLAVTPKRLEDSYRRYYVPNNAALVVTGDVSAERVLAAARRHFGSWRQGPDPFAERPVAAQPPLDSTRATVLTGDVGAVTVRLQWRGPSVGEDPGGTYDADVLSDVVNDPESAFTRRLVDEGPFQSARLQYETLAHTGPITFIGTTTADRLSDALAVLVGELTLMQLDSGYFEPRALATAAKRRRVAESLEREEGVTLAHALAEAWAVTGLSYRASYVDSLAARRPADLARFVSRYLAGRPFVAGVLAPPGQERAASALLRQVIEYSEAR